MQVCELCVCGCECVSRSSGSVLFLEGSALEVEVEAQDWG